MCRVGPETSLTASVTRCRSHWIDYNCCRRGVYRFCVLCSLDSNWEPRSSQLTMSINVGRTLEAVCLFVCLSVWNGWSQSVQTWYREWPWDNLEVAWLRLKGQKIRLETLNLEYSNSAWVRTLWVLSSFFYILFILSTSWIQWCSPRGISLMATKVLVL